MSSRQNPTPSKLWQASYAAERIVVAVGKGVFKGSLEQFPVLRAVGEELVAALDDVRKVKHAEKLAKTLVPSEEPDSIFTCEDQLERRVASSLPAIVDKDVKLRLLVQQLALASTATDAQERLGDLFLHLARSPLAADLQLVVREAQERSLVVATRQRVGLYERNPTPIARDAHHVYEGRRDGRRFALKWHPAMRPHEAERARRELQIGALVAEVDGLVGATDYVDLGLHVVLVVPFLPAAKYLDLQSGSLEERLARWLEAVSLVERLHSLKWKLVHRDLKPQNFLRSEGKLYLLDFGLAKPTAHALPESNGFASFTRTGRSAGTPAYVAPEQEQDLKRADQRADVFSLGKMLFEAVRAEAPTFRGPPAESHFADFPEGLRRVCMEATAPDPSERIQSAEFLRLRVQAQLFLLLAEEQWRARQGEWDARRAQLEGQLAEWEKTKALLVDLRGQLALEQAERKRLRGEVDALLAEREDANRVYPITNEHGTEAARSYFDTLGHEDTENYSESSYDATMLGESEDGEDQPKTISQQDAESIIRRITTKRILPPEPPESPQVERGGGLLDTLRAAGGSLLGWAMGGSLPRRVEFQGEYRLPANSLKEIQKHEDPTALPKGSSTEGSSVEGAKSFQEEESRLQVGHNWEELIQLYEDRAEVVDEPAKERMLYKAGEVATDRLADEARAEELFLRSFRVRGSFMPAVGALRVLCNNTNNQARLQRTLRLELGVTENARRRGQLFHELGVSLTPEDPKAALQAFVDCVEANPASRMALVQIEELARKLNQWEALTRTYETLAAHAVEEQKHVYLFLAGSVHEERLKRADLASRSFLAALEAKPGDVRILKTIAKFFEKAGDYQSLAKCLEAQVEGEQPGPALFNLLRRLAEIHDSKLKNTVLAQKILLRVVDSSKNDMPAIRQLYTVSERLKDPRGMAQALELEAGHDEVLPKEASRLYEQAAEQRDKAKDGRKALENVLRSLELNPKAPKALKLWERVTRKLGDWKGHERSLQAQLDLLALAKQTQQVTKARVTVLCRLADVCELKLEDKERAIEHIRRALELDPNNQEAQGRLKQSEVG